MIYQNVTPARAHRSTSRLLTALIASASGTAMMFSASAAFAQTSSTAAATAAEQTAPVQTAPADAPPTTTDTVAGLAAGDAAGSPAAQDIVVTGSRITAAGFDAPTPTTVLGADLLAKAAQPNIFTAVTQLPSLQGSTGTSVANNNTSTGATGLSGLNLRGLGTFRTLTLLDGQRVVPSNVNNITDISQFPQLLVQRVEVVTGGASASYGSDAVAGVVNFITNKRFEGFKANIQGGITTYGDDQQGTVQAAYGTSLLDGKLHVIVSGEFFHSDGIIPGGKFGGLPVNGRKNLPQTGASTYGLTQTPAGQPQTFYYLDGAQTIIQAPNGLITSGPLRGTVFAPIGGGAPFQLQYGTNCIINTCQGGAFEGANGTSGGDNAIDARVDRYVAYGRVSYELSDRLELFGTVNLANVFTVTQPTLGIPQPNLTGRCDNFFLPQSIKDSCNALVTPNAAGVRTFQFGTIGQNLPEYITVYNERKQRRFVAGLDGSFDLLGKAWTFESYFQHGKSYTNINVKNNVLRTLYNNATDAIQLPSGQVVCRSVDARANGCIPFNGFGGVGPGNNDVAAFRYFAPTSGSKSWGSQRQEAASIAINGTPFKNWAGDVTVAFGAEYREEAFKVRGDPYGAGFANTPTDAEFPANPLLNPNGQNWFAGNFANGSGQFNVKDFFFETGVPLFDSDVVGKLDFNGAIRATDYSTSGWVTTWKLGATYETPIDGLRLRVVRSRDIRAPNLSDLFSPAVSVNSTFLPRLQGTETPFNAPQRTLGNPRLDPEIASNLEAGVVYSPAFVPGLRLSFDYFRINLKDAIQTLQGQQIVDLCRIQNNQDFCGLDNFNLTGNPLVDYVNVRPFNVASVKTKGYDIEASYRFSVEGAGDFTIRGLATHTLDFTSDPGVSGQAIAQLAGNNSTNNPAPGNVGIAEWKAFIQESWDIAKFTFTATQRIVGAGKINPNAIVCSPGSCPLPTVQNPTVNFNKVPGRTYIDLGVSYEFSDQISVFGKADNVFNKLQPRFGSTSLYDTIGRRFQAGVRLNY
jgi:iron complex outermembrane receptor protein